MRKCGLLVGLTVMLGWGTAWGQLDSANRELIQMGIPQQLNGAAPFSGYAYYYLNEPNFFATNVTLRLAFAGVYADTETGFVGLLGPHTDVGVGLAGGGFADDYYEFQRGRYIADQSFYGHNMEGSVSVYHTFNPRGQIPLYGVFRIREHYSLYQRDDTSPKFTLPADHSTIAWRAGLRWGGREPLLLPNAAMELSAWYEGQYRTGSGYYGYNGDRVLNQTTDLYWARALLRYTFPDSNSFSVNLTFGGSGNVDRFSAYRLGGEMFLDSEFPLVIPGYIQQELSARDFVCLRGKYTFTLDPGRHWSITPGGTIAAMDYAPGLSQPGHFNSGLGLNVGYASHSGVWQALAGYGYGFEAIRSGGRGGQDIYVMLQIDLWAHHPGSRSKLDNATDFLRSHF
jgi:hypothetical protein